MEQTTQLSDLLVKIRQHVENQGYIKASRYYYIVGINNIRRHFEQKSQVVYSRETAWEYVLERRQQYENGVIAHNTFLYTWKVAEMLEECYRTGVITRRRSQNWGFERLCPENETLLAEYERKKAEKGYLPSTLISARSAIRYFLFYLEHKGKMSVTEIDRSDISGYIPLLSQRNPSGISGILSQLRTFFRYLAQEGLADENLILSLQLQESTRKKVRFGFTLAEIDAILNAIDRSSNIGKRDYAMLLLAKHTGLRAIDVVNLKLNDIDWYGKEIRIVQHKTARPLVLPLETNVGNAIAEYILNARPDSDVSTIFLRTKAPYDALVPVNGSSIVKRHAKCAGVEWKPNEYKGFHSFRHALGTRMLSADIPLHTISEVLGHSDSGSTKPYLATNLEQLKMCAISLAGFECVKEGLK